MAKEYKVNVDGREIIYLNHLETRYFNAEMKDD